jgi:hypothetical protein
LLALQRELHRELKEEGDLTPDPTLTRMAECFDDNLQGIYALSLDDLISKEKRELFLPSGLRETSSKTYRWQFIREDA